MATLLQQYNQDFDATDRAQFNHFWSVLQSPCYASYWQLPGVMSHGIGRHMAVAIAKIKLKVSPPARQAMAANKAMHSEYVICVDASGTSTARPVMANITSQPASTTQQSRRPTSRSARPLRLPGHSAAAWRQRRRCRGGSVPRQCCTWPAHQRSVAGRLLPLINRHFSSANVSDCRSVAESNCSAYAS